MGGPARSPTPTAHPARTDRCPSTRWRRCLRAWRRRQEWLNGERDISVRTVKPEYGPEVQEIISW